MMQVRSLFGRRNNSLYSPPTWLSWSHLQKGDVGASRALKSVRVNPDNERSTIEINVNININGTNGKSPASEKMELTECVRNIKEQVPEICQTENGDEEKCQKWIKQNTDTFQILLDPCLKQLKGGEQKRQRMPAKKDRRKGAKTQKEDACYNCRWCFGLLLLPPLLIACRELCFYDNC